MAGAAVEAGVEVNAAVVYTVRWVRRVSAFGNAPSPLRESRPVSPSTCRVG